MTTRHIGIVACSAEGAALCYRTICMEAPAILGRHSHPEITMHTYPLSRYMEYIEKNDWHRVATLMLGSAKKLALAGAELAICPDNTIHQAFDLIADESPVRWLHIAREVASAASARKLRTVGIMGTRYLMEGPVYPAALAEAGIGCELPEAGERARINTIIFDELVNGIFQETSREYLAGVIEKLQRRGCDSVVLGCTELPLIIAPENSCLPVLDSTRLLARAALSRATETVSCTEGER